MGTADASYGGCIEGQDRAPQAQDWNITLGIRNLLCYAGCLPVVNEKYRHSYV